MIKRLFDIVEARSIQEPDAVALAAKENGDWKTYTYKDIWSIAEQLAGGLLSLGISKPTEDVEKREKIAIVSANRPEWAITDLASQLSGAVLTPLYPTVSLHDMEFILKEAEVHIVFIATKDLHKRFKDALKNTSSVKHVFSFDEVEGVSNWKELIDNDHPFDKTIADNISEDSLATIIYTSLLWKTFRNRYL